MFLYIKVDERKVLRMEISGKSYNYQFSPETYKTTFAKTKGVFE